MLARNPQQVGAGRDVDSGNRVSDRNPKLINALPTDLVSWIGLC